MLDFVQLMYDFQFIFHRGTSHRDTGKDGGLSARPHRGKDPHGSPRPDRKDGSASARRDRDKLSCI